MIHVNRQVRLVRSRQVFSLPKRNETRSVPMPSSAAEHLRARIENPHRRDLALARP
jgi:hypothetical protein